jgi:putative endonuclease
VRQLYLYILARKSRRLYTGITNSLEHRVWQHRTGNSRHTAKYKIHRLVYFERFATADEAIAAEKKVKAWTRAKRVALIESLNPAWDDLASWLEGGKADPSLRSG